MQGAWLKYEAMLERPEQARAFPDPMVAATLMVEDVVTANGPSMMMLEIAQEIPFAGKRALKAEVSRREAEVAERAWRTARLDVAWRVRAAYYEIFRIDASIAIVRQEAEVIDRIERSARARYATGGASQGDVLRAQTERSMIEERLLMLRREREAAAAMFNEALDRPQTIPVGRAVVPPELDLHLPPDEELFDQARRTRPEVDEARRMVAAEESRKALARRDFYPDFRVGVGWNQIGDTENPFAPDPGQDAILITVGINVPLWQGWRRAQVAEAGLMAAAAEREVHERGNDAEAQVRSVLGAVRLQRDLIALYDSTLIPQAESTLRAGEAAYGNGRGDFLSVIDSERALLTLRLGRAVALGELGASLAALDRALGREPAVPETNHADKTTEGSAS